MAVIKYVNLSFYINSMIVTKVKGSRLNPTTEGFSFKKGSTLTPKLEEVTIQESHEKPFFRGK